MDFELYKKNFADSKRFVDDNYNWFLWNDSNYLLDFDLGTFFSQTNLNNANSSNLYLCNRWIDGKCTLCRFNSFLLSDVCTSITMGNYFNLFTKSQKTYLSSNRVKNFTSASTYLVINSSFTISSTLLTNSYLFLNFEYQYTFLNNIQRKTFVWFAEYLKNSTFCGSTPGNYPNSLIYTNFTNNFLVPTPAVTNLASKSILGVLVYLTTTGFPTSNFPNGYFNARVPNVIIDNTNYFFIESSGYNCATFGYT